MPISKLWVAFVIFLSVCRLGRAQDNDDFDEIDILALKGDSFDKTLAANKFVLVEFFAPWCVTFQLFLYNQTSQRSEQAHSSPTAATALYSGKTDWLLLSKVWILQEACAILC